MATICTAGRALNERRRAREGTMRRRVTHAIFAAAAAGAVIATFGLTAAGTAGAATGPARVVYGQHYAGYGAAYLDNWRFRYVATTVPVAACRITPSKNPDAET